MDRVVGRHYRGSICVLWDVELRTRENGVSLESTRWHEVQWSSTSYVEGGQARKTMTYGGWMWDMAKKGGRRTS